VAEPPIAIAGAGSISSGGRTWRTGNMSRRGPSVIGSDPITVFDPRHGTVIHLSLNFKVSSALPATR
jgi:hypothetical protein